MGNFRHIPTTDEHSLVQGDTERTDKGSQPYQRVEELPEQKEDGEYKKQFKERGGNVYIREGRILEADTIILGVGRGIRHIYGAHPRTGVVGAWSVDKDNNYTPL
jgi:hypothetical protein